MSTVRFEDGTDIAKAAISHKIGIALAEAAVIAEGECIARCPVRTGHLRGSISRKVTLPDGGTDGGDAPDGLKGFPEHGEAVIGTNVEYAAHVEYGTRFQRPQPFMRTGMDEALPKIRRRFQERLGEKIGVSKA